MSVTAGWCDDPTGRFRVRYWDGAAWTEHVANDGPISSDPLAEPGPPGLSDLSDQDWEDLRFGVLCAASWVRLLYDARLSDKGRRGLARVLEGASRSDEIRRSELCTVLVRGLVDQFGSIAERFEADPRDMVVTLESATEVVDRVPAIDREMYKLVLYDLTKALLELTAREVKGHPRQEVEEQAIDLLEAFRQIIRLDVQRVPT